MQSLMNQAKKLLKDCHATRFGMHIAYKSNFFRTYSKDSMSVSKFISILHDIETKEAKGHKVQKLQEKYVKATLRALDAMGLVNFDGENMQWLITEEMFIKHLLPSLTPFNTHLMESEPYVLGASREGGLSANDFQKQGKSIFTFEQEMQKMIIPAIVEDIRKLYEWRKQELKMTGKLHILSVGCGNGAIETELAKKLKCAIIHGYDPNPDAIKEANTNKPEQLEHLTFSTESKFKEGDAHVVLVINVLHDVVGPDAFIRDISKMVHKHGIAVIVDPMVSEDRQKNVGNPQAVTAMWIGAFGCVLSTDCNHAKGPATGKEALLKYIQSNGLRVVSDQLLAKSKFYHGFIAEKEDRLSDLVKSQWHFTIKDFLDSV